MSYSIANFSWASGFATLDYKQVTCAWFVLGEALDVWSRRFCSINYPLRISIRQSCNILARVEHSKDERIAWMLISKFSDFVLEGVSYKLTIFREGGLACTVLQRTVARIVNEE